MANANQLAILKKGVKVWNKWRRDHPDTPIDLRGVELGNAALNDANLHDADLREANLTSANLNGANLQGAKLGRAKLIATRLRRADLADADLARTDLFGAYLIRTDLAKANVTRARIANTTFGDLDLSTTKGLETITHAAPSIVSIGTLYRSQGKIPEPFLRGCGVPNDMIKFIHSQNRGALELQSCFISHSSKDKRFCERLYADLQAKGVRVWMFEEDAKWGESVWGEIDRSIRTCDKLVVVCSKNSLMSVPVQREIERALGREDREKKNILFPIRIDDYIFKTWDHARKTDVLSHVVGDFSKWNTDARQYKKSFEQLLKGLETKTGILS